jgi:glucosamine kinase
MYTLVVDSGSTKADWAFINREEIILHKTRGINGTSGAGLNQDLEHDILKLLKHTTTCFFYGAGATGSEESNAAITNFITCHNTCEIDMHISSDMVGAVKCALGDHHSGIVCILGTGSNSCLIKDGIVVDTIPSLGYILSDEGSGNHLGKEILKSYFYRNMDAHDQKIFEEKYISERATVLQNLYKSDKPSSFLASYTHFLNDCSPSFKDQITELVFNEFIETRIKKYPNFLNFDIYFIGSVASHFSTELIQSLAKHNIKAKEIITKPIIKLVEYHKSILA